MSAKSPLSQAASACCTRLFCGSAIVSVAIILVGCATPELARVSYHDLPESVRKTVKLQRAEHIGPGAATMRIQSHATADQQSPWAVPIESRGNRWTVRGMVEHPDLASDNSTLTVDIDTGAVFMLYLSAPQAKAFKPWIIEEIAPETGITAYGRRPRLHGLLERFTLLNDSDAAVLSFEPAVVSVGKDDKHERIMLGMGMLKSFEHVILDWPNERMILANADAEEKGEPLRESLGAMIGMDDDSRIWEEMMLFTNHRSAMPGHDDPESHAAAPSRIFRGGLPIVLGEVAGTPRLLLLDTGFTGELSDSSGAFTVPVAGFPRLRWARAFGQQGFMLRQRLDGDLRLGEHTFTDVHVIQSSGWKDLDAPLIVGMEVLGQMVMWLDHDAGVVRLGMERDTADCEAMAGTSACSR